MRATGHIVGCGGLLLLLLWPVPARALDWKPFAAFGAAQAADVWTSRRAFDRGCREANQTWYDGPRPSVGQLVERKLLVQAPAAVAAWAAQRWLAPRSPRWARWMIPGALYGTAGATGIVAYRNWRCGRP